MKNKMTIIARCGAGAVGLVLVCLPGVGLAQNPHTTSMSARPQYQSNEPGKPTSASSALKSSASLSAKDKAFMSAAAKGGMMEVEGGKMAAQNGKNADVKKFGNRMVTDHSKANNELMSLAASKGVKLSSSKSSMKWKSDKDYMDMMVKDHEKDLAEFQTEAKDGTDADLKKFADQTSKVIKKHLDMAREIDGKLK